MSAIPEVGVGLDSGLGIGIGVGGAGIGVGFDVGGLASPLHWVAH